MHIYQSLLEAKANGEKKFAMLIDPDKVQIGHIDALISVAMAANVDFFFVGGSLIVNNNLDECLAEIRHQCDIPLILFPGDSYQLSYHADAILFLSLISGRNAELLIGKHVITAPYLKLSQLEVLSCGYILIDGGVQTTVSYMSNTQPIPSDKEDIAVCTALAGEMLGLKMIYLDAGSGAILPVSEEMITAVSGSIDIPLIVGGGIQSPEKALLNVRAGADLIVVGNAIEKDVSLIQEISDAVHAGCAVT
ncbi:MAG: geranylgeranylglyceryl/heptaprenylglyceryl phosphate synthase [Saprospiraceae bacterium]|nr:geranylgeranylglyceryl/heptaprenylglyceryl phosphate synthase [Saprospiraceae bacterium]